MVQLQWETELLSGVSKLAVLPRQYRDLFLDVIVGS
jgi:hypothetical protein